MNFMLESNNTTGIDYEYYISCDFGINHNTYSTNDTSTFTGDYLKELMIFKV